MMKKSLLFIFSISVLTGCSSTSSSQGLAKETVRNTMKDHSPEFRKCYDKSLKDKSAPTEGRVVLKFEVAPSGVVTGAEEAENTMSLAMGTCLLETAKKIKFPSFENDKPTLILYPLSFEQNEQK
jgi:hypothetical protein